MKAEQSDRLVFQHEIVSRFVRGDRDVVAEAGGSRYRGRRLWVCAGALHSPALLDASLDVKVSRPFVSDHVFCYLGQIDRSRAGIPPPCAERTRDGVWFKGSYDASGRALCTMRPALFSFRRLDYGISQRSTSLKNGRARRIGQTSLGLFVEALYVRSALFSGARMHSVYAQINVPDAYQFDTEGPRIVARGEVIQGVIDGVRARSPWSDMQKSRQPKLFIPSSHLHGSVDVDLLAAAGVDGPASRVQVIDASVLRDIGPDHHSFKLMAAAFQRAQALARLD